MPLAGAMSANDNQAGQFRKLLKCPECGQAGLAVWSEDIVTMPPPSSGKGGARSRLVFISPGFHPETGRTPSNEELIVCDDCDMIQPG